MTWDYVIIGSGFGGSVSALRLVERGYSVLVLEKGRRLKGEDFPKTNWNLKKWLWLPQVGFRGLFKMSFFRHVTVVSGVGVGGGSLVYANTLPVPGDEFFRAKSWAHLASWKSELAPHYKTVRRMLGAEATPFETFPDKLISELAAEDGRPDAYGPSEVAVYFGTPGVTVEDPYFDGKGPTRTGCARCGGCMLGCRHNAKNTLDKNYLHLAELLGLQIRPNTEVVGVTPHEDGGYSIEALDGDRFLGRKRVRIQAEKVIFAGGVMGTVPLLLRLRDQTRGLPGLSSRLGDFVRTNSEVLMGIVSRRSDRDLSKGIAIGSIYHTDQHSHLEPVRYSEGAGFFRTMALPHAPGETFPIRAVNAIRTAIQHPVQTLRAYFVRDWAKRTMILLYMRTLDGHLKLRMGRSMFTGLRRGMTTDLGDGPRPQASIPEATELAERIADKLEGSPQSMMTETLLGIPTTAHILGGCSMGTSAEEGVIDHQHRVHGYDGLYVIDGSAISANPGVNPSLTIAALAERAMTFIPPK